MKLSKEKRDRIILVILVGLAVSWGLWQFVIKNRSARLAAQRVELTKQQGQLTQALDWIERAQSVEAEMNDALETLADVEAGMGNRLDPYAWSYLLLDNIRRKHASLRDLDVAGKPAVGPVKMLPSFPYEATTFTVVGKGHYHDFGKLLADFENDYPYFRVENIELTSQASVIDSQPDRDEKEILNFKFDVVALIKPPSK